MNQKIYVFAGGTFNQVAPHLALSAPAFGTIGIDLYELLIERIQEEPDYQHLEVVLLPTSMALGNAYERLGQDVVAQAKRTYKSAGIRKQLKSNQDLLKVVDYLVSQQSTRCIMMTSAVCDFEARRIGSTQIPPGFSYPERLDSRHDWNVELSASEKIINRIRSTRKDIFLVSFKATYNQPEELYSKALAQLKRSSSNLVFANDILTRKNMVVTPEEYPYKYDSRIAASYSLVDMTLKRLNLHFSRTIMRPIESTADLKELSDTGGIPSNFIPVLSYAISHNAFKPFNSKTTGHFGCVVEGQDFQRISSVRKVNHNRVFQEGVAKIYINRSLIEAGGAKPSVGEHTQQMIYQELQGKVHSIIHFHCPLKNPNKFKARRKQFAYECGSVECGMNTTKGMQDFGDGIYAVHLDQHGPNIAFHRDTDPQKVIEFIDTHWDLKAKEGGLVEPQINFDNTIQ